ncbi:MAG: VF530 family protein [Gemmatimonadaceae bacterium]|nr:VF530 family protein [Gemmatimonadaceae bacterium]
MLEHLVARYGWSGLGERIRINCFLHDPTITSSLRFLRRTPWARAKVESLYVHSVRHPTKAMRSGGDAVSDAPASPPAPSAFPAGGDDRSAPPTPPTPPPEPPAR